MEARDLIAHLKHELTCAICLDYFTEPVLVPCGHTFCKACLLRCWEEAATRGICPECKAVNESRRFIANLDVENLTLTGKLIRPHLLQMVRGPSFCKEHQQVQELFCEDDQRLLCNTCFSSKEHMFHKVSLLKKAAESYRKKLQETLEKLKEKTKEADTVINNEKKSMEQCQVKMQTLKGVIVFEYAKMYQFLREGEKQHLECLENHMRENWEKLVKSETQASRHSQHLQKTIGELEDVLEKPASEMLLDARSSLERSEAVLLQCPQATFQEWPRCQILGMRDVLMTFHRDITLDPKTANPYLLLSEDLKSVTIGSTVQDVPDNPERFDGAAIVLGTQKFTQGRHYWEVEVGDKTEWSVGICRESTSRKGQLLPADVFSLTGFKMRDDFILWVHDMMEAFLIPEPLHKLGIYLDYECGHIAFYNITSKSLIYSLLNIDFQGPLRPFFSPCIPNKDSIIRPLTISTMTDQEAGDQYKVFPME
ncbi:probable E3 ubiquitin-protein ligase TRIML1 [Vombatus ursinus]|uniref:probable E3 ubiquitin-protein ligase TRIML1 n=1 Tax=Vombatus ursinus TaxID=29139 RepID=UPI000FFD12D2|nr:probable E3 ubiquitin-protein ligase TRIML1 [Vombatus ursinus]